MPELNSWEYYWNFLGEQKVSLSWDYTSQEENASLQYMNVYHIFELYGYIAGHFNIFIIFLKLLQLLYKQYLQQTTVNNKGWLAMRFSWKPFAFHRDNSNIRGFVDKI
jgi:hypothetical protein